MKVTADQAQRMREQALALSKVSAQGPDEMARSYYFLASAGLNAEQAMAALPVVTAFATAGAFDMAKATEYLTDAQSALGLKVADATQNMVNMARVADVLVYAANASNASVEQFAMALTSKAGSSLKMFNKSVEEGVAVLAVFADQGIKAELAGNNFSRVMLLLGKAQLDNKKAFDKYNLSLYDGNGKMRNMADIIQDLERILLPMSDAMKTATLDALGFEARVQGAILPLIGASSAIRRYEKELRAAGGTTADVADKQMKSFSNQIKMLWNNIKILAIGIGEQLAPKIMMLGGYVKDLISTWNSLSETTKSIITNLAIFAAAIGPLAVGISVLIKFVSMLGVAIAAVAAGTPAAMLILATAVTAGLIVLIDKFADAVAGTKAFNTELEQLGVAGEKALARVNKRRYEEVERIKDIADRPERDAAGAAAAEKARQQLKVHQRDLQRKNKELQEASKGQNWLGEWVGNDRIFATAEAEYKKAKAKFDAALDYYRQLEGIGAGDKAADVNANLAELDRMDALQTSINDYVKDLQKASATVGMNEAQVKLWEFAHDGATASMLAEARAAVELTAAVERHQKALETGKAMIEEYLTPLEKLEKRRKEIAGLFLINAFGYKTAERASLAANKEYKEAEKALRELQMKANIRINFDFTNNKAVREGTDEFYALMQLVPNAGELPTPKDKGGAVGPGGADAKALSYDQLRELEDANWKLENIARNTARPPVIIEVANAGLQ
jgi:TP901 family phage tail tape measure protein